MSATDPDPNTRDTERRSIYSLQPFGAYWLVQKLAEGGMAEIFLAKQIGVERFERNVVIKRMLSQLSRQTEFVDMFLDEARLASRLNHPNITPIYDLGLTDGCYYICMEYLPGEDLAWILRRASSRGAHLPIGVAVRIIADAARGLHFAHEFKDEQGRPQNVVHRDISPSNIYVSYEGQVKVLDFGIAKAESRITTTSVGGVKGKVLYMSPEQSLSEPVDRRCDVYSLGVTLYEALTLGRPFARDSPQGIFDAVLHGFVPPPRARRPEIPPELEAVVLKAMARAVDDRYATAAELADALEGVLGALTPGGSGGPVGRYLQELCGELVEHKTRIPNLATLQAAAYAEQTNPTVPLGPLGPANSDGTPTRGEIRVPTRRWRGRRWALAGIAVALACAVGVGLLWRSRQAAGVPDGCDAIYGATVGPDTILLGATLPLSIEGRSEDGQNQLLNALRLALDEINQRDGVAGRRFALRVCDNGGEAARLRPQVKWLVEDQKVPALITSWSSLTLAAVSLTLPRGVLTITADATSPELAAVPAEEGGVRMLWRTAPSDATQGRLIADLIAGGKNARVGILYQDDPYGQGLAGVVASRLARAAPSLKVHSIQYPLRGDVTTQVRQLAAARPDVTLLFGFPLDATRILNLAAREPNLTRAGGNRWFFSDSVKEPTLFTGLEHPGEIDGALGMEAADGGGDEASSFQARFQARFLRNAVDQTYASNRYDAMYVLALGAAHAAGRDGKGAITGVRMAEGLTHLSSGPHYSLTPEQFTAAKAMVQRGESIDVDGASGKLDFNPRTGEAPATFRLWRVTGQRFVGDARVPSPSD